MPRLIILLSGPIGSGKSTLGDDLVHSYGAVRFKTNQLITTLLPATPSTREALQSAGEALDQKTKGLWVRDALIRILDQFPRDEIIIVDCVRIREQIRGIRKAFGSKVYHVHLTASDDELERRYKLRRRNIDELATYKEAKKNKTEANIGLLQKFADIVVLTDRCTAQDVLVRVTARLGLYPRSNVPLVDVLIGGQYGSEGKGHIASYLAREYRYLISRP